MAVLCNLASRSKSVCLRIRKSVRRKIFMSLKWPIFLAKSPHPSVDDSIVHEIKSLSFNPIRLLDESSRIALTNACLQTSYKNFCKILMKLLAHDSRIVVVAALILVGYLEEKLRDTVISCFFVLWLKRIGLLLAKYPTNISMRLQRAHSRRFFNDATHRRWFTTSSYHRRTRYGNPNILASALIVRSIIRLNSPVINLTIADSRF